MKRVAHILFVVLGSLFFVLLSVVTFPYFFAGVLCRAIPFISRRRWLVNALAMILPLVMRYGSGQWAVRFGEMSSETLWLEVVAALVDMAFAHIFVWAGFLSLNGFLGGIRRESTPMDQSSQTKGN